MAQNENGAGPGRFDYARFSEVLEEQFRADPSMVMEGLRTRLVHSSPGSDMEKFSWDKWSHYNEQTLRSRRVISVVNARPTSDSDAQNQATMLAAGNLASLSYNLPIEKDHVSKLAARRWHDLFTGLLDNYPADSLVQTVQAIAQNKSWEARNLRSYAQFMLYAREPELEDDLRESAGDYPTSQPRGWTLQ